MPRTSRCSLLVLAWLALAGISPAETDDLAVLLKTIQRVESRGKGNRDAGLAWRRLAQADASSLPAILLAMDDANPLAANWLRSAAETIADRQLDRRTALPVEGLEAFVLDTRHDPRGRRLAFELLERVDPAAPDRLIPGMLDDPALEFRRDAVNRLLDHAGRLKQDRKFDDAARIYLQALDAARDQDQTEAIAASLDKMGRPVDLAEHFGFVLDWQLIGPFDNAGGQGFDRVYPPESAIELMGRFVGKNGEVVWAPFATNDVYGVVDLAKALGPHKGAAAYAVAEFTAAAECDVELRIGSPNALKVWVNAQLVFERDEYHRGMEAVIEGPKTVLRPVVDQFHVPARLRLGRNAILIKVCQNEQTEDWAQLWQFQVRVCDASGAAILSTTRPPSARDIVRGAAARSRESSP